MILLPENLFYNTSAAGVIVVLSRHKPAARKGKIVMLNASRRVKKGRPKNYIPEEEIRPLAASFLAGKPVDGELGLITIEQAREADYNVSPSRWVGLDSVSDKRSVSNLLSELERVAGEEERLTHEVIRLLQPLTQRHAK